MIKEDTILGYTITTKSKEACVANIIRWMENGEYRKYIVCANPHSLEVARNDNIFKKAIKNADIIVPDGIGILLASMILGGHIRNRVTGSDIFLGLSSALNKKRTYSYFFLGSTNDNLRKIKNKIQVDYPNIKVAGTYSPPFKSEFSDNDNRFIIDKINSAQPDVLWLGMTAPKQEKWVYNHINKLDVKFIGPIGAVFDFYTGKVKRSHPFFQSIGIEWLPRFLRSPKRLWRRNLISNPNFLIRILALKFK